MDDGTEQLDTFSVYQGTLVFKTNVPDKILAYKSVSGSFYKTTAQVKLYEEGSAYEHYASGSSSTSQGERHSSSHYESGSQYSREVDYIGYGWYEGGSSVTLRGGKRSGTNQGSSVTVRPATGSAYTGMYQRDSDNDKTVTGPNFDLYVKNDNKRTIYKRKQAEYPGDLFYKDDSQTQVKRFAVDRLTFNPATISTQQLTMLTV